MPMELLRELAARELPVEIPLEDEADKVRVLCAAGLVAAFLPSQEACRPHEPVTVLAITDRGWRALEGKLVVA